MSMNLYITVDGRELELYQTPSHITNMCMMGTDGEVKSEVKGKKAQRAIACYLEYVNSMKSGAFKSQEDYEMAARCVNEHVGAVTNWTKGPSKVVVYML